MGVLVTSATSLSAVRKCAGYVSLHLRRIASDMDYTCEDRTSRGVLKGAMTAVRARAATVVLRMINSIVCTRAMRAVSGIRPD